MSDIKRVYIDGIFDLFHIGHLESFKKTKKIYKNVFLIVGVISDDKASSYKRKPIINESDRYDIIQNIKCVDEVIFDPPLIIDKNFIEKNNIDMVVHGFFDDNDKEKQKHFFKVPIKLHKFHEIEYYKKESTSNIINRILTIHR